MRREAGRFALLLPALTSSLLSRVVFLTQLLASLSSADELALLSAEYALLDEQLRDVALEADDAACLLYQDGAAQLEALSREIPDLRSRLGIG